MYSNRHDLCAGLGPVGRAAFLLVLFISLVAGAGVEARDAGDTAPGCALTPVGASGPTTLAAAPGEVLLVDFWASWCPVCPHVFLFLNELDRDFGERGLKIVGVSVDEDLEAVQNFLDSHPAAFNVAMDPSGDCPEAFGVERMPATYLIDQNGQIRLTTAGFKQEDARVLRHQVEALLDEARAAHTQGRPESP
jgi:peroxiredoxin